MTAQASLQTAIQAVNEGAFYYIQKPSRTTTWWRSAAVRRTPAPPAENKQLKQEIRAANAPAR